MRGLLHRELRQFCSSKNQWLILQPCMTQPTTRDDCSVPVFSFFPSAVAIQAPIEGPAKDHRLKQDRLPVTKIYVNPRTPCRRAPDCDQGRSNDCLGRGDRALPSSWSRYPSHRKGSDRARLRCVGQYNMRTEPQAIEDASVESQAVYRLTDRDTGLLPVMACSRHRPFALLGGSCAPNRATSA